MLQETRIKISDKYFSSYTYVYVCIYMYRVAYLINILYVRLFTVDSTGKRSFYIVLRGLGVSRACTSGPSCLSHRELLPEIRWFLYHLICIKFLRDFAEEKFCFIRISHLYFIDIYLYIKLVCKCDNERIVLLISIVSYPWKY